MYDVFLIKKYRQASAQRTTGNRSALNVKKERNRSETISANKKHRVIH